MSDDKEQVAVTTASTDASAAATGNKAPKAKPIKVLPTDRLGHEKQLSVLRGYAAAAGPERKSVSHKEVAAIVKIHEGTISNCNPFFADVGLIERDGYRYRPAEAVLDYANSFEWDAAGAAAKMAAMFESHWAAKALLPRLAFRSMPREEAIGVLAEAAKATKDYKVQLEYMLEYLRVVGLVISDGNTVSAAARVRPDVSTQQPPAQQAAQSPSNARDNELHEGDPTGERFHIPIPGKKSALIVVPRNLTPDDWDMLQTMLKAYIARLQKLTQPAVGSDDEQK
ncbi:MAG: hypothetical protein ACM3W7_05565 [Acidobacteriota bacterium]